MGIIGRDPSVSNKSNRLHVDVFPFFCLLVFFFWVKNENQFEVYSVNSSKMIGNAGRILNSSLMFLTLNRCICV